MHTSSNPAIFRPKAEVLGRTCGMKKEKKISNLTKCIEKLKFLGTIIRIVGVTIIGIQEVQLSSALFDL